MTRVGTQDFGGTSRVLNLPPSIANGQPVVHQQLVGGLNPNVILSNWTPGPPVSNSTAEVQVSQYGIGGAGFQSWTQWEVDAAWVINYPSGFPPMAANFRVAIDDTVIATNENNTTLIPSSTNTKSCTCTLKFTAISATQIAIHRLILRVGLGITPDNTDMGNTWDHTGVALVTVPDLNSARNLTVTFQAETASPDFLVTPFPGSMQEIKPVGSGGGSADLASPGPIGGTTPNTGVFTFLSGSRQLVTPAIAGGTTLTRAAHVGRSIMVDGGTITLPADANWQTGDEVEVIVVGTNTTTISGNSTNITGPDLSPSASVVLPGVIGAAYIFKKMPGPIIYLYGGVSTLNDLSDVLIVSPRRDDVVAFNGLGWTNLSLPFSINDRLERAFYAAGSGATITTFGIVLTTTGSTINTPQAASTSVYNKVNKFTLQSASTAGAIATLRCGNQKMYRGANASEGGFRIVIPFGLTQMQVGQRGIISISTAGAPTNVDPLTSTAGSKVGVGFNANTGNWSLIYNNAGTAPTVVPLGVNFPIDVTTWFEMYIWCLPGGDRFFVEVVNKTTNQSSGILPLTTNIPAATNYLFPNHWMTNNATAASVTFALGTCRMEYGI